VIALPLVTEIPVIESLGRKAVNSLLEAIRYDIPLMMLLCGWSEVGRVQTNGIASCRNGTPVP